MQWSAKVCIYATTDNQSPNECQALRAWTHPLQFNSLPSKVIAFSKCFVLPIFTPIVYVTGTCSKLDDQQCIFHFHLIIKFFHLYRLIKPNKNIHCLFLFIFPIIPSSAFATLFLLYRKFDICLACNNNRLCKIRVNWISAFDTESASNFQTNKRTRCSNGTILIYIASNYMNNSSRMKILNERKTICFSMSNFSISAFIFINLEARQKKK